MNRLAGMAALLALLLPGLAAGAEIGADGTTIIRVEERSVPGFSKQTIVPATQYLGLDINDAGMKGLSMHFYGWGRIDLGDDSGETRDPGSTDGNFSYGYLQYRFDKANATVKGGRFFVYEGVAAEQIDGIYGRTDLKHGFTVAAFAGVPVELDRSGTTKGDFIAGGRMGYRYGGILDLGLSGLDETSSPGAEGKEDRKMYGADLWFSPHRMVELAGRSSYNGTNNGFAEHSYNLFLKPLTGFSTGVNYTDVQLDDYFTFTNTPPTLFNPNANDSYQSQGFNATYRIAALPFPTDITFDYKHYKRDSTGSSDRFGGELRIQPTDRINTGFSFARVEAADGIMSFNEARGFGMYSSGPYSVNLDVIADFYDEDVYGKSTAYEIAAGCGYQINPALRVSGEASYADSPLFDSNAKALLRLTYAYTNKKGVAQ